MSNGRILERITTRLKNFSGFTGTSVTQVRPGDFVILGVAMLVVFGFSYHAFGTSTAPALVRIEAEGRTFLYPLGETRTVKPLSEDGTCRLLIEDNGVQVVSSDCPERICVSRGRIFTTSQWIACLPHQVFVDITGATSRPEGGISVDAATY